MSNTLVVAPAGFATPDCLVSRPAGATSVIWLGVFDPDTLHESNVIWGDQVLNSDLRPGRYVVVAGVSAQRRDGRTRDHRLASVVFFPDRQVYVAVSSPQQQVIESTLANLTVTRTDAATGCSVHVGRIPTADLNSRAASAGRLVLGKPSSVTGCRYDSGWLEQSQTVAGIKLQRLVVLLNSAPPPTTRQAPEDKGCRGLTASDDGTSGPIVMTFRYPDGTAESVIARQSRCTRWQSSLTNGRVTRRITGKIILALPALWPGFPDPATLNL